ncbi:Glycosyltransferase involved in cell wall bisynthesis [Cyclobacterium lianum]|uniref:Glycosyltransferase involved in cell wall bisynthesis n=2 Tax=Cyclobacterium lianum TaxID=388280 RepID=A0A1M7KFE6_9BACT|nr:Glycosyltransferase involved in cell wall bisynthesis [Cyclobacterium lianum]
MKLLLITNMYPAPEQPSSGVFIKEQIEDVQNEIDLEVDVFLIDGINRGKFEYLKSIFTIPYQLSRKKYDAIHVHYGISGLFLLFFRPKIKKFMTLHGCDIQDWGSNFWNVWITKKIIKNVDLVYVQNQKMKSVVEKINPNVEIMPCGTNSSFFAPPPNFNKKAKSDFLILFPGSPKRTVKNYPLFLEVMRTVEELGIQNIQHLCLENMSREQVKDAMLNADCLLMTSISEGSPQVIKEALYCDLPIVSVPVGDVADMLAGIPKCKVANTFDKLELARLLKSTLSEDYAPIRESFMTKNQYNNQYASKRLARRYSEVNDRETTLRVIGNKSLVE